MNKEKLKSISFDRDHDFDPLCALSAIGGFLIIDVEYSSTLDGASFKTHIPIVAISNIDEHREISYQFPYAFTLSGPFMKPVIVPAGENTPAAIEWIKDIINQ